MHPDPWSAPTQPLFQALATCERGGVALLLGLALPVLVLSVGAVVEYGSLTSRRATLQAAADAGALSAARELTLAAVDAAQVQSVARDAVHGALGVDRDGTQGAPMVTATVGDSSGAARTSVTISVRETVTSVFGRAFILPETELTVNAVARLSNRSKICVVGLEPRASEAIRLDSNARLSANGCSVHSNSTHQEGIKAQSNAVLSSTTLICSAGGIRGGSSNVRGPRVPDCPAISNPMADRDPPPVDPLCRATDKRVEANATLQPGTYCKGLFIGADARVTFSPGVYVIKDGVLRIDSNADVWGRNVGFHFVGNDARFEFTSNARVNLGAPKDGPMAGILFYGDPNGTAEREFKITSNYANTLVGTIYLPKDRFVVDSSQPVADQSAWTAIVVKRMTLLAQPHLVLNTNYSQTDVPVPQGFSGSSDVRLSR